MIPKKRKIKKKTKKEKTAKLRSLKSSANEKVEAVF